MATQGLWILPLLARLRRRPGMYLGNDKSVQAVALYVAAFYSGRESVQPGTNEADWEILRKFAAWLAESRGEAELKGWVQLVLDRAEKLKREDSAQVFSNYFMSFAKRTQ